ncbi:MAG: LemA family protein [Elusimicrobia bacterium]|nr:LemA family protein [Elusimicrobiota bacterium]
MKNGLPVLIIGIVLIVIIGISWYINGLNRIVRMDESVTQSWAEIENQLQRRNDLIPNLVNTVKGYAKQEQTVFMYVADARAKLAGLIKQGGSLEAKIDAAKEVQGALSRLLAIAENYPQLKSNENFLKLQDELAGTENRIAVSRTRYNRAVQVFNTHIREVFGSFFAKKKNLDRPQPYYEIDESAKDTPKVNF